MTALTRLPDLEEELARIPTLTRKIQTATGPGFAEIKKHNSAGIKSGLEQLRRSSRPGNEPCYLITYMSRNRARERTDVGVVVDIQVFAIRFEKKSEVPFLWSDLNRLTWMNLGLIKLPKESPWFPPVGWTDAFGYAVEEAVRRRFIEKVVKKRPDAQRGGLGRPPSTHDVIWNELAEFYSELARELAAESGSFRF